MADLRVGDACELPWADAMFDVVTQFTLFTSILDTGVKRRIASEMLRVLKPDGMILWYDFRYNNPRNANVRGIEAKEVRQLFPGCGVTLEKVTLAPLIARWVVPVSWLAALVLEKIPVLRTHYLGATYHFSYGLGFLAGAVYFLLAGRGASGAPGAFTQLSR